MGEQVATTGIQMGMTYIPGPEVVLFKLFLNSKYASKGFQLLKRGGKWVLGRVTGKGAAKVVETVDEAVLKSLYVQFKKETPSLSFWKSYISKVKGVGRFELTPGYSTRRIAGEYNDVVVYWVINKGNRQILKVGETKAGLAASRWGQYKKLADVKKLEVEIEYIRFDSSVPMSGPNSPENMLRKEFEQQGHQLPWDLSGKRNPADFVEHP